jgi:hypothetical protein
MYRIALLTLLLACGSEPDETDNPTSSTIPGAANCTPDGVVEGCLNWDSEDCETNTGLDGAAGGWFNDDGSSMRIGLAPTPDGVLLQFTVLDGASVATGGEYAIPTEVLVEFIDTRNPEESVSYYACPGILRITNYQAGVEVWGTVGFQAHSPTGICGEVGYASVQGEFIELTYCADG